MYVVRKHYWLTNHYSSATCGQNLPELLLFAEIRTSFHSSWGLRMKRKDLWYFLPTIIAYFFDYAPFSSLTAGQDSLSSCMRPRHHHWASWGMPLWLPSQQRSKQRMQTESSWVSAVQNGAVAIIPIFPRHSSATEELMPRTLFGCEAFPLVLSLYATNHWTDADVRQFNVCSHFFRIINIWPTLKYCIRPHLPQTIKLILAVDECQQSVSAHSRHSQMDEQSSHQPSMKREVCTLIKYLSSILI